MISYSVTSACDACGAPITDPDGADQYTCLAHRPPATLRVIARVLVRHGIPSDSPDLADCLAYLGEPLPKPHAPEPVYSRRRLYQWLGY